MTDVTALGGTVPPWLAGLLSGNFTQDFWSSPQGQEMWGSIVQAGREYAAGAAQNRQNEIDWKNKEIDRAERALAAQIGNYEASNWANKERMKLERQRLQLDREFGQQDRELNRQRFGLDQELGRGNLALKQNELGLSALEAATRLRGPQNYRQAAEYARGVGQMPGVASYLRGLMGQQLSGWNQGAGTPDAVTLGNVLGNFYGGPGTGAGPGPGGGWNQEPNAFEKMVVERIGQNPGQVAPGQWESLTTPEKDMFTNDLETAGFDPKTWLTQWRRSRLNMGSAGAA